MHPEQQRIQQKKALLHAAAFLVISAASTVAVVNVLESNNKLPPTNILSKAVHSAEKDRRLYEVRGLAVSDVGMTPVTLTVLTTQDHIKNVSHDDTVLSYIELVKQDSDTQYLIAQTKDCVPSPQLSAQLDHARVCSPALIFAQTKATSTPKDLPLHEIVQLTQ